ncbi:MAG: tetratricopeptide repeat protein [Spirosomataceae bacterium]
MSKKQKVKAPIKPTPAASQPPKAASNSSKSSSSTLGSSSSPWLYWGIIVVATAVAFIPGLKGDFIWDDNAYVVESTLITPFDWQHFKMMWTTPFGGNYHPLTMISLGIERALVGTSTFLYHFDNLLLHIANSLLVFELLKRMSSNFWASFVAGLLFGIHPLHVESVTWITERKDVLYCLFLLLSLWQYLNFRETEQRKALLLSIVFFVCSCLSKGMAVVLPVILIITDYYIFKRPLSAKLILDKIPYFVIALIFGIVAINAQKDIGADASKFMKETYGAGDRFFFLCYNFAFYWIKMLLPLNLSLIYPYPDPGKLTAMYYATPLIMAALIGLIFWLGKRDKMVWWSGVYFVVCILPVVQLIPIGSTIVAERYFYVSSLGPLFLLGWVADRGIQQGSTLKTVSLALVGAVSLFFMVQTFRYNKVWKDNLSLFTNAMDKYPTAVMAIRNVGAYYLAQKDYDKAIFYYSEAKKHSLVPFDLEKELGLTYYNKHDYPNAAIHLDKAYNNAHALPDVDVWMLGDSYYQIGQYDKAMPYIEKALKERPQEAQLYNFLGMVYMKKGQEGNAVTNFERAMTLNTSYVDPYTNMSFMYISTNQFAKAAAVLERALKLFPDNIPLMTNMGFTQSSLGNLTQALALWKRVVELNPQNVGLFYNIGNLCERTGNPTEALSWYKQAAQKGSPEAINLLQSRGIPY